SSPLFASESRLKKNGLLPAEVTSRRATDRRIHASFEYRKVIDWKAGNRSPAFPARFASANQPPGLKTGSNDRPAEKAFALKTRRAAKAKLLPQFEPKVSEKMEPSKTISPYDCS